MPQRVVSTSGMSLAEGTAWFFVVLFTCGFAYPAYRARKHKLDRTTTTTIS